MNIKCKCGSQVKSTYKFCPFCGAPVEEPIKKYSLYELLRIYTDGQLVEAVDRLRSCDEATIRNALFNEKIASPTVYVVSAVYYDESMLSYEKRPWRKANHREIEWLASQDRRRVKDALVEVIKKQASPSTMAGFIGKTVFYEKSDAIKAAEKIATANEWTLKKEVEENDL